MNLSARKWLMTVSALLLSTMAMGQTTGETSVGTNEKREVKLHTVVYYKIRESDNAEYAATTALSEVAEFMRRYTNATATIVGYADKGTGNPRLNLMYAQRRATNFRDDLIGRYGIDASRLVADSRGDAEQPFTENDRNRCVVIDAVGYEIVAPEKMLTADEIAEQQRAQAQAEKERHYLEEMARHNQRVDTIYVIQTDTVWMADAVGPETPFGLKKERRWRNWFLQAGVGPGIYQGDHNRDARWGDRLYTSFNASFGKWIYPALGVRVGVDLDEVRMMYNGSKVDDKGEPFHHFDGVYEHNPRLKKMAFNAWNFRADVLLNVSSFIWSPYTKRYVNIVPFVGFGRIYVWDDAFKSSFSLNAGLLAQIRLSERLDLNIDARLKKFDDDLNWFTQGHHHDGIGSVNVGLTWNFTKRGF